jgi:hypothetical protein
LEREGEGGRDRVGQAGRGERDRVGEGGRGERDRVGEEGSRERGGRRGSHQILEAATNLQGAKE